MLSLLVSFAVKTFSLMCNPILYFFFLFAFVVYVFEILSKNMCGGLKNVMEKSSMLSSNSLIVLILKFKSLIYLRSFLHTVGARDLVSLLTM